MKIFVNPFKSGLFAALLALTSVSATRAQSVVDVLAARPEFSTLVTAVTEAGLVTALEEAEGVTIFAPDNRAFSRIPEDDLAALLADPTALADVLLYHISPEEKGFFELENGPLPTLLSESTVEIDVARYGFFFRRVKVNESFITRANISASNGVIHRINRVLDPAFEPKQTILEIAAGNPDFSILTELVTEAGFDRALDREYARFTVFAPPNSAFEALGEETLAAVRGDRRLLRQILLNHIVFGTLDSSSLSEAGSVRTALRLTLPITEDESLPTGLAIDGKPITSADIEASNGIVHVVGEVLIPPAKQSLVDVAGERNDLSTFVLALDEAGLAETFDSTRRWPAFTVFAPNNAAFEALPEGALDALLADPTGALADTLKLHVVRGRLTASRLFDGQLLHTLSGDRLEVSISEDGVISINNAVVAEADLTAENGVIHVVESVIAQDPFTIADYVADQRHLSTLEAALAAANLTDALDDIDARLTLFAPLNFAFDRLPEGTLEALLAEPGGQLTQILLYHVIPSALQSSQLEELSSAVTLQGQSVEFVAENIRFWPWFPPFTIFEVNGIRIFSTDIEVDNGIIHIIGGILLPEDEPADPDTSGGGGEEAGDPPVVTETAE